MTAPRQARVGVAGLVLVTGMLAVGCEDRSAPEPDNPTTWGAVLADGYGDAVVAIGLYSNPDDDERVTFYLALVGPDGRAQVIKGGQEGSSQIASDHGRLCVPSDGDLYTIGQHSGHRETRPPGLRFSSHWTGVAVDGTCVFISNDGGGENGYETSVYTTHGGKWRRSVVPDVPDSAGLTKDAVWVTNSATSSSLSDQHSTIYRTDLVTGQTDAAMTWPLDDGAPPNIDLSEAVMAPLGSGTVVGHDGHLYFLDENSSESLKTGEPIEVAPGMGSYARLVELNPETGTQQSTLLYPFAGFYDPAYTTTASGARLATWPGYAHKGSIFRVDDKGQITAVDLDTHEVREIGPVSPTLRKAPEYRVEAAGHGKLLTFAIQLETGEALIETYNLDTGKLVYTLPVTGLEGLFARGVSFTSVAPLTGSWE
ncbi:hypothetical protein ACFFOS_27745 [Nocardioides kongjuensis]|uniref:Uncharacterized protein n=1 Tax=Nocardioides kongjuensis TaxID=349522 RepID=A0A852RTZ3_9ACTN|nr:hypothetical protein [Nocardioides kongjuensis]NYD32696.1 hypothetical protein [Nocardioides kongjuensis]